MAKTLPQNNHSDIGFFRNYLSFDVCSGTITTGVGFTFMALITPMTKHTTPASVSSGGHSCRQIKA